ncbi:unnamed protein product, partial [Iphiclides podalirius]
MASRKRRLSKNEGAIVYLFKEVGTARPIKVRWLDTGQKANRRHGALNFWPSVRRRHLSYSPAAVLMHGVHLTSFAQPAYICCGRRAGREYSRTAFCVGTTFPDWLVLNIHSVFGGGKTKALEA